LKFRLHAVVEPNDTLHRDSDTVVFTESDLAQQGDNGAVFVTDDVREADEDDNDAADKDQVPDDENDIGRAVSPPLLAFDSDDAKPRPGEQEIDEEDDRISLIMERESVLERARAGKLALLNAPRQNKVVTIVRARRQSELSLNFDFR
jgi:hypothetical protein